MCTIKVRTAGAIDAGCCESDVAIRDWRPLMALVLLAAATGSACCERSCKKNEKKCLNNSFMDNSSSMTSRKRHLTWSSDRHDLTLRVGDDLRYFRFYCLDDVLL